MEQNNLKQSYVEKSGVKAMPWSTFFNRTTNIPLDRSSMFGSIEDAQRYAKGDKSDPDNRGLFSISYVGQIITVYENGKVDIYKINEDRSLGLVGEGKGTVVVEDISNSDVTEVGQLVLSTNDNSLYVIDKDGSKQKIQYQPNENDKIVVDCGTFGEKM